MAVAVLLRTLLAVLVLGPCWRSPSVEGVTFTLRGNSIPTDGSGRVNVTDINPNGDNSEDALICRSEGVISTIGDWFLHPTQMSIDVNDRVGSRNDRGWHRNRDTDSEGRRILRLRRDADAESEEGVFTCDFAGDTNTPRYLGIYYPMSVSASIGVVSGREGTFRVTCTATGGTLSTSSLTGSGLRDGDLQLQAEGSIGRTGQNTYSVTSDTLSGHSNGDTYTCRAMNNVSSPMSSVVLEVASAPTLESLQQISATSVRVMWSQPSGGAPVAGYEVHYRTGSSVTIKPEPPSSTTTEITGLTDGSTYTISVEATSQHLSGESEEMTIKLLRPANVRVDGVADTSVTVFWQAVDDADSYTITFTKTLGADQEGLCLPATHRVRLSVDAPSTSASIGVGQMLAADDTTMLRAYTTYFITVVAVNDVTGSSGDSVAITVTTAQTNATVAPRSITATVVSSTVITVQWDGLPLDPCRHANGLIVLYRVQYTEVASGVVQSKDEPGEWNIRNVETSLTGLIPFTNYSIQIAAVNEDGDVGLYTDPITRQTEEDSETRNCVSSTTPLIIGVVVGIIGVLVGASGLIITCVTVKQRHCRKESDDKAQVVTEDNPAYGLSGSYESYGRVDDYDYVQSSPIAISPQDTDDDGEYI